MIITIDAVLSQKGRTRYWLSQKTGITYPNIKRLCDNNTSSIKFVMIDNICKALECEPNDIFQINDEKCKRNEMVDIWLEKWEQDLKYDGIVKGSRV